MGIREAALLVSPAWMRLPPAKIKEQSAMSVFMTDCEHGLMLMNLTTRIRSPLGCPVKCPYLPCVTENFLLCACRKDCDCCLLCRRTHQETARFPALPAMSAMCASGCGRYLYQLSSEADCIHTRHLGTGELLYACKAGVFPRDMKLKAGGRLLFVAGGASGEALIFRAPELLPYAQVRVKGCCCGVDQWQGGLVLVCAVEDNDIHTSICTLPPNKIRPTEILRLEGQPGGLCVCPDGYTAIVGTLDGLMKICLTTGRLLWNLPGIPLCSHISCRGDLALASGDIKGQVQLFPHEQPWLAQSLYAGGEVDACFA